SMASYLTEWVTSLSNLVILSLQVHRAPSVGFFLLGISAAISLLHPSSPYLTSLQREAEWAAEVLAPVLVSFDFLWLSQDHNTAQILLCGSCLLLGLSDWLSGDTLTIMTRCLGLSSLSCCLMVCLFAGNASGAFGSMALSLPLLLTQRFGTKTFAPLLFPAATEGLMKWLLKGSLLIGCWVSTLALGKFLFDVTDQAVYLSS
uniref:Uncharacterized protein n=1 Tax=Pundamilia nyererei TaxID=303518 RepID=A0A3B4GJ41_9CICH